MVPSCHNELCLFQHEVGCMECKACAYCGESIGDAGTKPRWMDVSLHSLLDACNTTVPTCNNCRASKGSLRLKDWLIKVKRTDPERYDVIVRYHKPLHNTISLVLKRMS